jgi:hypothetical protein
MLSILTDNLRYSYYVPFVWGLITLSGFIGWGVFVNKLLNVDSVEDLDWGYLSGCGLAFTLFTGGVLNLLQISKPAVLFLYIICGSLLHIIFIISQKRSLNKKVFLQRNNLLYLLPVILLLFVSYAGTVAVHEYNISDDAIGKFPLIKRMVQTGTIIDPFSFRRLTAYGGQMFLEAIILSVGSFKNMLLIEDGISKIILFGLIIGFFRKAKPLDFFAACIVILIVLFIPLFRFNISSTGTGIIMFFTLFRLLEKANKHEHVSKRFCWLLGLVLAAISSLKSNYTLAVVGTIFFYFIIGRIFIYRSHVRRILLESVHVICAWTLCLLPWSLLMYISSDTFFWPLIKGTFPSYYKGVSAPISLWEHCLMVFRFVLSGKILVLLLPIVVFIRMRKQDLTTLSMYFGALLTSVSTIMVFSYGEYGNHFYRLAFPILYPAFIAAFISVAAAESNKIFSTNIYRKSYFVLVVICASLLIIHLAPGVERTLNYYMNFREQVNNQKPLLPRSYAKRYKEMQSAIPEGETLLVMVHEPFALDFSRNRIFNIDMPGQSNIDGGMPFYQGHERLKHYLLKYSIHYVAFVNFNNTRGVYDRSRMKWKYAYVPERLRYAWNYFFDVMRNIELLAMTEKVIYNNYNLKVIQLIP